MLRSDICHFSDAYIVEKAVIAVTAPDNAKGNKAVTFENNASLINCTLKVIGVQIYNVEDLDVVVMSLYDLLEYNKNYKKTTGNLWSYYRDEPSNPYSCKSESFKYKTSITENTYSLGVVEHGYDTKKW